MDTYVKHFFPGITVDELAHDQFYTNTQITDAYKKYAAYIVSRYKEETSVLGWEAANDPRCNSTLPARSLCNPQTVTSWTSDAATHIKENDPNHLVATGDSGYYCVDCVKLYPVTTPPPPQTSPLPGKRRKRWEGPLTAAKLMAKDAAWKKRNLPDTQTLHRKSGGIAIRGKWFAPKEAGMYPIRFV
jgi:mannan endo-1,4-beta-mannosidase